MLFPIKSSDEMLQEMMTDLQEKTGINNFNPGSVARSLLETYNRSMNTAYEYLNLYAGMTFLSTAEGPYLDMIGYVTNCFRRAGENNENYRFRISKQVFSAATANKTAIRLACLSVPNVVDVKMTPYTHGSGSFSIQILTDELEPSPSTLEAAKKIVEDVKAEGVRAMVSIPRPVPLDLEFSFSYRKGSNTSSDVLSQQAKTKIQQYLDSMGIGAELSIQKIISEAMAHEAIDQLLLSSFKIDNEHIIIREMYPLKWDERAYIRNVQLKVINR